MKGRVGRRHLLQAAAGGLTAAATTSAGCTGFLEDDGYDATDPSYLPLVAHPEWQGDVEGYEGNEYKSASYVDVQGLSEHYDVLPNGDRWESDGLDVDNPEVVEEYVVTHGRTRTDPANVVVARLRDDVDADAYAEAEDDRFVDASTDGYRGNFSDATVRVYGNGLLAKIFTVGPSTDPSEERRDEVIDDAAELLANQPDSFPTDSPRNAQLARLSESVREPTMAILQPGRGRTEGVEGIGTGLSMGAETTWLRTVGLVDGSPSPESFRKHRTSGGYGNYEELETAEKEDALWLTGRSPTKYVDFLDPGTPAPRASFAFDVAADSNELTVTHDGGVSIPADRCRVVTRVSSLQPTDTQWEDEYDVLSEGDAISVTVPDDASSVRVEWLTRGDENKGGWTVFDTYRVE